MKYTTMSYIAYSFSVCGFFPTQTTSLITKVKTRYFYYVEDLVKVHCLTDLYESRQ